MLTQIEKVRRKLFDLFAERDASLPPTNSNIAPLPAGLGDAHPTARAIHDAMYARLTGKAPDGAGREWMTRSLLEMGAALIEIRGERPQRHSRDALLGQMLTRAGGLHSTSDFPNLLTAAGNRVLLEAYQASQSPLRAIARERSANDFRTITMLRLSEAPKLLKVNEGGEVKRGTRAEAKEAFRLSTFARIFGLTRQAIINDDLNAFGDSARAFGQAASETEASEIVALFTANSGDGVKLDDGGALYGTGATRKNKANAGAAPDTTTLGAARQAMREQKGLDGVTPISAVPPFWILACAVAGVAVPQQCHRCHRVNGGLSDIT